MKTIYMTKKEVMNKLKEIDKLVGEFLALPFMSVEFQMGDTLKLNLIDFKDEEIKWINKAHDETCKFMEDAGQKQDALNNLLDLGQIIHNGKMYKMRWR